MSEAAEIEARPCFAQARAGDVSRDRRLPRRLVYIVNRREYRATTS